MPPENEEILIFDNEKQRIKLGRYINGRWYVEDLRQGELSEVAVVTHWGPILDSEAYDAGDD